MYGVSSVSALTVISVEFVLFAGADSPVSSEDAACSVEFVLFAGTDSPVSSKDAAGSVEFILPVGADSPASSIGAVCSVEFVLFAGTDSPVSSKDAAGSVEFVLLVGVDSPTASKDAACSVGLGLLIRTVSSLSSKDIACATGSTPFSDQSHSGSLPNHLVSTSQPPPLRKLVSTIFGTSTHSRASMIPAYTPVIAPRYTSILLNACFMPSSTLTSLIGNSVCPPTMRSTSQLPSFQPPITGTSLGTCTLLLTTALAPMPRYKYFVSFFVPAPPNAPSSIEVSNINTSILVFGKFSSSASEPTK